MPDQSELDRLRFIDWARHNCPYCNRRHVSYSIREKAAFDWTDSKPAYAIFVKCHSCEKVSLHLSFEDILTDASYWSGSLRFAPNVTNLDDRLFYSVPTSFFTLDPRIPRILRELFAESEGCLKGNYLTGASACARKVVYELAVLQEAKGDDYETRLKSLKALRPDVEPAYFDTLLTIQQVTSTKVHEGSYDGWESRHLRVILAALHEILAQLYVLPAQRDESRKRVLALKDELLGEKQPAPPPPTSTGESGVG